MFFAYRFCKSIEHDVKDPQARAERALTLLGTAALTPDMLLIAVPFPFIVWGADELRRWFMRRREASPEGPLEHAQL
jgi:starvation-inducible outer membrane lipoprotein